LIEQENQKPEKKPIKGMAIVGYNMLAVIVYSLAICIIRPSGIEFSLYILIFHMFFCVVMAILSKKSNMVWAWVLTAIILPIVSFSTCFMLISLHK